MQVLMGLAMLGASGWALLKVWASRKKVTESLAWPSVRGRITACELRQERSGGHGHQSTVFRPEVSYSHSVSGRDYVGHEIHAGGVFSHSLRGRVEDWCARHPVGAEVQVHYDPQDPAHCCLQQDAPGLLLHGGIATVFLVVGSGLILAA